MYLMLSYIVVVVDSHGPRQPASVINCYADDRVRRVAPSNPSQSKFLVV